MLPVAIPFYQGNSVPLTTTSDPSSNRPAHHAAKEQSPSQAGSDHPMTLRHRSGHSRVSSIASSNGGDDVKSKVDTAPSASATPAKRGRGRPRKARADPEEEPGDETFSPSPALRAAIVSEQGEGDIIRHPDHRGIGSIGDDADWESAALAWGLTTLGGLGVGSAAVFGAECVAR